MKAQTAERLNGVNEYYFSGKLAQIRGLVASGKDIINLGIGNPDLSPDKSVIDALVRESAEDSVHGYQSYRSIPELREAFSKWYSKIFNVKLDPDTQVLPLIGSKEGVMHISLTFLNRGDTVLVPDPGYPAYESAARLCGARVLHYNLTDDKGWQPDFEELNNLDIEGAKLMWVNYPNMPTGAKPGDDLFKRLEVFAEERGIILVNDNPYGLILNTEPKSILNPNDLSENVMELNSLSKSHNMAGWRMGVLAGSEENINAVLKVKSNMDSGMFLPVQKAAIQALSLPNSWYLNLNSVYSKRKLLALEFLKELGSDFNHDQAGMFIWSELPAAWDSSYDYSDYILDRYNLFITPGSIFGTNGRRYIRTSLCVKEELFEECIKRVKNNI